jgi:hypothetical protein
MNRSKNSLNWYFKIIYLKIRHEMNNQKNIDDLFEKIQLVEKRKKIRNIYLFTSLTIILILGLFFITIEINNSDNKVKVVNQKNIELLNKFQQEDNARNKVLTYFHLQNDSDSMGIFNLLADSIIRYYLVDKITAKSDLIKSKYFEVNKTGRYQVDSSFKVSVFNDTLSILVKTPTIENNQITNNILHEIKMNKNYEIIYVRAYDLNSEKVSKNFHY